MIRGAKVECIRILALLMLDMFTEQRGNLGSLTTAHLLFLYKEESRIQVAVLFSQAVEAQHC